MIILNTHFSDEEKRILLQYAGDSYEILTKIEGDSYILSENGNYRYNECFCPTDNDFFAKQRYEKTIPYRIIKFYQYYLMNVEEKKDVWYRGHKDINGNWEYECYSDSLEEAFESL